MSYRAIQLIELGRYENAIEELQRQLKEEKFAYADTFYLLALCYLELGNFTACKNAIDRGLAIEPNAPDLLYVLARYYHKQQQFSKALQTIKNARTFDPHSTTMIAQEVRTLYKLQRFKEGAKLVDIGLQTDPNDVVLLSFKALLLAEDGETIAALNIVTNALKIEPENETLHALRAGLLVDNKNAKLAEQHALEALRLNPNDEFSRGMLLQVLKNRNGLLRFFVGNSFNRYRIEWTVWRVILFIVCWKGVMIWGAFLFLYMLVTWYGGVLYNSVIRLHEKYALLLSENDRLQSNYFLSVNAVLIGLGTILNFLTEPSDWQINMFGFAMVALFVGISFFEISTRSGKTSFYIAAGLITLILGFNFLSTAFVFNTIATLLLLLYGALFTLRVIGE